MNANHIWTIALFEHWIYSKYDTKLSQANVDNSERNVDDLFKSNMNTYRFTLETTSKLGKYSTHIKKNNE